jgi:hypothetical protein
MVGVLLEFEKMAHLWVLSVTGLDICEGVIKEFRAIWR